MARRRQVEAKASSLASEFSEIASLEEKKRKALQESLDVEQRKEDLRCVVECGRRCVCWLAASARKCSRGGVVQPQLCACAAECRADADACDTHARTPAATDRPTRATTLCTL